MDGVSRFRRFRRWRLAVGGVVLAALVLPSVSIAMGASSPFQNVIIANTPASPVPVNVGNLPATQPVSGTVNVGNLPIPIPFQVETNTTIRDGHNVGRAQVDVPAGMQLILERVSGRVRVPTGQAVYIALACQPVAGLDGQTTWFTPELFAGSLPPNDGLFFNESMQCYAGPGRTVAADATRYQTAGEGEFYISFFGHLLPQP